MDSDIRLFYSERRLALLRRVQEALDGLPVLDKDRVPKDESCAICLTPFTSILSADVSHATLPNFESGITKVIGCGHMFCRKDLTEWIRGCHGSCPTCRHPFLDIQPLSESDAESSDGDYVPEDDEEEEEDDFGGDDFEDEFGVEDMDVDFDDIWGDSEYDGDCEWADSDHPFEAELELFGQGEVSDLDDEELAHSGAGADESLWGGPAPSSK